MVPVLAYATLPGCPPAAADADQQECRNGHLAPCLCQCAAGIAASCGGLGFLYLDGYEGTPVDPALAAEAYQRGCNGGDSHSCAGLGSLHAAGDGVARDLERAAALFEHACRTSGEACGALAQMLDDGIGMPEDDTRAAQLYEAPCRSADHVGCYRLGRMYEEGHGGLPRDLSRAFDYYRRGIGVLTADERDASTRAEALAPGLCSGGNPDACLFVAALVRRGRLPGGAVHASELEEGVHAGYDARCTAGDGAACRELLDSIGQIVPNEASAERDRFRARDTLLGECEHGDGGACADLSRLCGQGYCSPPELTDAEVAAAWAARARGETPPTPEHTWDSGEEDRLEERAVTLLRAGCAASDAAACFRLADVLRDRNGYDEALEVDRRGCALHDEDACADLREFAPR